MPILEVIIPAGGSLSAGVDLGTTQPCVIFPPAAWTPANLYFVLSPDNVTYYDAYRLLVGHLAVPVEPTKCITLNTANWPRNVWVKFRSGTPTSPIAQVAERRFRMMVV
jgi:hypothetical protein